MISEERFAKQLIERSRKVIRSIFADRKEKLFAGMRGVVVEIGPGAGVNLQYYPKDIRWIGVEPNPFFADYIKQQTQRYSLERAEVKQGTAQELPVADGSVDAVVSTQVLCSVDDVVKTLAEVRRVLKEDGKFYFLEHGVARRGSLLRLWQALIKPWYQWRNHGCRLDREILQLIRSAGFARVDAEEFMVGRILPDPYVSGVAIK
jgi:ubiquinone/menaquinone biosynthesis C-methylase UbiE